MAGIELPGGVQVAPPSPELQALVQIAQMLDLMLQFQCRVALGWDPAEAIEDMRLKVKPVPGGQGE